MTKTALALRFLAFEDLGTLEPLLRAEGYEVHYLDVGVDELGGHAVRAADLVVVLGGPIGANDGDTYPVVDDVLALLRLRLADGQPTLGICLGAQLIARALGASVAPGGATEIGFGPLELTADGQASVLRYLADVPVLHWHNDRFTIPIGARRLAATPICDNQAFSVGTNVLALQFHLEVPEASFERWLIGHADALMAAAIDPRALRQQSAQHAPAMENAAALVITEWLAGLH